MISDRGLGDFQDWMAKIDRWLFPGYTPSALDEPAGSFFERFLPAPKVPLFKRSQDAPATPAVLQSRLSMTTSMLAKGLAQAAGAGLTTVESQGRRFFGEVGALQGQLEIGLSPEAEITALLSRVQFWKSSLDRRLTTVGAKEEARLRGQATFGAQVSKTLGVEALSTLPPWALPAAGGLLLFLLVRR